MIDNINVANKPSPGVMTGDAGLEKRSIVDIAAKADIDVKPTDTFFSPVIRIDTESQSAILMYRDTETGEVEKSFPSESKVEQVYKDTSSEKVEKPSIDVVETKSDESGAQPSDLKSAAPEAKEGVLV